jgi:hypothetical protein
MASRFWRNLAIRFFFAFSSEKESDEPPEILKLRFVVELTDNHARRKFFAKSLRAASLNDSVKMLSSLDAKPLLAGRISNQTLSLQISYLINLTVHRR